MLVRYFVELSCGVEAATRSLLADPDRWVARLAREADANGTELLTRVGFGSRVRVSKEVEIRFGEPTRLGDALYLPISWRATGLSEAFPVLEGDLEIAPLGDDRAQLAVSARYTPPLKGLGRMVDRGLLHRVAESTVKDFLDRVAERLCEEVHAGASVADSQH